MQLKWINRFAPLYRDGLKSKIRDLPQGTVVETSGNINERYEEVLFDGVKGWIHTDDLEDYIRNFPVNCVVIENQTPDLCDFQQFVIHKLHKQVNLCGELCVCYSVGVSLGTLLDKWELQLPSFYKRVFGTGKARGTGSGELREMLKLFDRESVELTTALFQSHIKRSRYTMKGLQSLLATGKVIVSVHIDGTTGLLRGSGILHWVALTRITSERNGQGMVTYYNPAMNCVETCSWNEFLLSAGQPYGIFNILLPF